MASRTALPAVARWLIVGAIGVFASAAGAQASPPPSAVEYDHRDAAVAMLLSVVLPGGGQMYAGRPEKGLRLFALDLSAALVGGLSAAHLDRDAGGGDRSAPLVVGAIGGVLVALGTHIYSIATAPGDAHAYNAERHPVAALSPVFEQRNGHAAIGLALVLR